MPNELPPRAALIISTPDGLVCSWHDSWLAADKFRAQHQELEIQGCFPLTDPGVAVRIAKGQLKLADLPQSRGNAAR
jgi:hypothetical protein